MEHRKIVVSDEERALRLEGDGLIYEEGLVDGKWCGKYWSASGRRALPGEGWCTVAFVLRTAPGGQEIGRELRWLGSEIREMESGGTVGVVRVADDRRGVTLAVNTAVDGSPAIARWIDIANEGATDLLLQDVVPWCGRLWVGRTFTVGYYSEEEWAREGWFRWEPVGFGTTTIRSDKGQGFNKPFVVVRNEVAGEYFAMELAWSANWRCVLDRDDGGLNLSVGPDGLGTVQRVVAPGEAVSTPVVHLVHTAGAFDGMVQEVHRHIRRSVRPASDARGHRNLVQYVLPADQGYYMPFTEDSALRCVDIAAAVGVETFILDAYWWDITPDWEPSETRFPGGLDRLVEYVRSKQMGFGLYIEPEAGRAAGKLGQIEESRVYREHPEWFGPKNVLRLAVPEVAAWMESEVCRLIERYELDLLRIDYNPHFTYGGMVRRVRGTLESEYWRYYEAFYAVWERVSEKYPGVILQQCAAGGGRNDLGVAGRFHENYLTDGLSIPRELQIYSGVVLGLPPERLRILHGADGMGVGKPQDLQTVLRISCSLSAPHLFTGVIGPDLVDIPESRLELCRRYIELYKSFMRPGLESTLVYLHDPVSYNQGVEPREWFCIEFACPDQGRGWALIVRMRNGQGDAYVHHYRREASCELRPSHGVGLGASALPAEYVFKARGVEPFRRYRVTYDGVGSSGVVSGLELQRDGLPVRLENVGMSELLLFEGEQ